jgi:hypothetical protein
MIVRHVDRRASTDPQTEVAALDSVTEWKTFTSLIPGTPDPSASGSTG